MSDPGYRITEVVLLPAECDGLIASLSRPLGKRGRAGMRHLMATPEVAALASDTRLLQIAREALGPGVVAYRATLFEKSGHANWLVSWHQDTALPIAAHIASSEWGPWSTKGGLLYAHAPASVLDHILALRVHLDASTVSNGPLRVIPGSHRVGVLGDKTLSDITDEQAPVECLVPRGGIMAMRPLLVHSSSKARIDEPRRVLHIEYACSLDLGNGVRLAIA